MLKTLTKCISFGLLSLLLALGLSVESAYADINFEEEEAGNIFVVPMETSKSNQTSENDELDIDKPMSAESMKELFGDDQVFPFVAGLDSY